MIRILIQTKSLLYVQTYTVKDQIDFSSLSGAAKCREMWVNDILPSTEEETFSMPVARIMSEKVSFFEDFKGLITEAT